MRPPLFFPLVAAVALLQVTIGLRWEGAPDHQAALLLGWSGALWLTFESRSLLEGPRAIRVPRGEQLLGAALVAVACALCVTGWEAYRPLNRVLPLWAGLGLALLASGARGLPRHARMLAVLCATLVSPLPTGLRARLMFLEPLAAAAEVLVRLTGTPVGREANVLFVPGATVSVLEVCSGMLLMGQQLVLALVLLCLFRTTLREKVGVVLTGVAVGHAVNVVRIALLTLVAAHLPTDYALWDGEGPRAKVFPVVSALLALLAWYPLLGGLHGLRARSSAHPPDTAIPVAQS